MNYSEHGRYLIDMEDNKYEDAFNIAIYASWICEDIGDEDNKLHCQECNKEALRNILMKDLLGI